MTTSPSTAAPMSSTSLGRWLLLTAVVSLLMRLWISVALPITGDEALFYWWSVFLDWGYYDHPPMVAWWIAPMRALLGDATWSIRLPVVLLPLGVGWALWWGLSSINRERAAWAVLFYWLTPIAWLNALITTDTPVIFWSAWSVAALIRAQQAISQGRRAWGLYALSGLFLGAAVLSKYFAVLLGLSYLVYFALFNRAAWRGFVVLAVCAVPAVLVNIGWNLTHCWTNIMFNLYNRNEGAEFSWTTPALYVLMMAYLVSPAALWLGFKHRREVLGTLGRHTLLACVVLVPLLCFGLMSAKKVIGLHWVMAFYPFIFVLLAWALPSHRLMSCARGLALFLALHVVAVLALSMTSLHQWQSLKMYPRLVQGFRSEQMLAKVQAPGVVMMSNGYTPSSIYGYAQKAHMPVFGLGSLHARQDDLIVDYAAYQGRTIRIIQHNPPNLDDYRPYFAAVKVLDFKQDGFTYYAVEGVGFDYPAYRRGVMGEINRRYYRFPSWLPVWGCAFCQRYCGAARCTP
ncbi:MAG: glycosyltransferase family 39 protein [Burkholderiales bacterium]|nr:glycosyltransferase family 39 protein [Burkholderiales bacterium]